MSTDDRMETITDPEQIRAVWEAGDMGEESLGGDSESGTYNRSNRPPAGPRPDADNPWALLPDDHPERPKQCGGCGTKWVDAETARACERRHGDDIATTPAPVGAAVELDLDAARAMLNAANTIKATGGAVEIGGVRIEPCDEYGSTVTTARAESAEAEVGTLRAKVAAVEAKRDEFADLLARALPFMAALARVEALCDSNPDHADTCGSMLTPGAGYPCSCWQADIRAALATTGEGQ